MNKKLLIGVGVLLVAVGLFFTGSLVGANNDWKTQVENEASRRIAASGHNKTEEIKDKSQDVSQQMIDAINPEIKKQEDELASLLEQYYQMKLQNLTNTPEFQALEKRLEELKKIQLERYKSEIDKIFSNM